MLDIATAFSATDATGSASTVSGLLSSVSVPSLAFALLNPWLFAAGVAFIAIPILIHILNRRRFKVVNWAAMEFLLSAMRKNRRRLKFEQWLLLATRCALLALLGLALARPMGCADSTLAGIGQRVGLHVIVIDNSYSMAYQADRPDARTHLEQAKRIAHGLIDRLGGDESVVVLTASMPAEAVLATPVYDLAAAKSAISRIEQTYGATDLAGALRLARQITEDNPSLPKRGLYLITDGTRSAWESSHAAELAALGRQLADHYRVAHFHLGLSGQWNHAVLDLEAISNLVTSQFDNDFAAILRGYGSGPQSLVQWKLDDAIHGGSAHLALDLDTPPQLRSLQFAGGGAHVLSVSLVSDDRLEIDDAFHRAVQVASELNTLIVEGNRGVGVLGGSAAFLNLALAPPRQVDANATAARTNSYVAPELISDLELGNRVLADYAAVILTNVATIQPSVADQLQRYVESGGTLMVFMGDQVSTDSYNATLLPRKLLPGPLVKQVSAAGRQQGFAFAFDPNGVLHPYLRIFRGRTDSGLETARVFTYIQAAVPADGNVERVLDFRSAADSPVNVLPDSDVPDRDPAITVHTLGAGRVVFVATTADPQWTSFPAKPSYVVLVHELLAGSVDAGDAWMNLTTGQQVVVPRHLRLTATPTLTSPQQRDIPVIAATDEQGNTVYQSPPLDQPGVYRLAVGDRTLPIAVNVPTAEADVRTLEQPAIRTALGEIDLIQEGDSLALAAMDEQAGRDYGWFILAVVLLLTGFECLMAMRLGHYRR